MINLKKTLRILGLFIIMGTFAIGMNACSKKGGSTNNVNPYGYGYGYGSNGQPVYGGVGGGGNLGYAGGYSPDGSSLELWFSGQDGGAVYASGILAISPQAYGVGCGVPPGVYQVSSPQNQPGQFYSGDFQNLVLIAQNGMQITIAFGWFNNSYVQMSQGQAIRMYAVTNIPGCPTNFN